MRDWYSHVSARNASSREAIEDQDDPLEYVGGEFDKGEPVESMKEKSDTWDVERLVGPPVGGNISMMASARVFFFVR